MLRYPSATLRTSSFGYAQDRLFSMMGKLMIVRRLFPSELQTIFIVVGVGTNMENP